MAKKTDKLIQELEAQGYEVRKKVDYVKHSFQVDKALLDELKRVQEQSGRKLKDCINEAITDWIVRHSKS